MSNQYISYSIAVLLSMAAVNSSVAGQTSGSTHNELIASTVDAITSKADLKATDNTSAYDYNNDELNSVSDVSTFLENAIDFGGSNEEIENPEADAPRRNAAAATADSDYLLKGSLTGSSLGVSLTKSYSFVAFQFDIVGTTADKVSAVALDAALEAESYGFTVAFNNISSSTDNIVRVIAYNLNNTAFAGASGATLATLTFSNAPTLANLSFSNVLFVSSNDVTKDVSETGEIVSGAIKGDVNGDGLVDTIDLACICDAIMNVSTSEWKDAADVDNDGIIDTVDLAAVVEVIMNKK